MLSISRLDGIGGTIKSRPEDFIVKEITGKGIILEPDRQYTPQELNGEEVPEGKFTTFILQKTNWTTIGALIEIAKKQGRGRKSIGYSGTKDKNAVSVQLASIFGASPANINATRIKDIKINCAFLSNGQSLGDHLGNSFDVVIRNTTNQENLVKIISDLDGKFPNYFDRQRFGSRLNNFRVGMSLLNNKIDEAVTLILTDSTNEQDGEAVSARKRLSEEMDFKKALEYFPKRLRTERTILGYLARFDNKANALRKIPRGISIMFIHAVQSLIFNASLENSVATNDYKINAYCKSNFYGFPDIENITSENGEFPLGRLIGYDTKQGQITDYEKEMLDALSLTTESFKIRSLPELSMRGSYRALRSPVKELSCKTQENDVRLCFSIPSGSYATIFINEITKSDNLDLRAMAPELNSL